ncbi:MAG: hypothetical protein IJO96_01970 [Oscillospiraceae bacterium]|nr:hypothetical protein [Oscillospiraceae bacterium]
MFDITKLFKKKKPALFTDILAEKGNTFIAGFRGFSAKYPENTMIGFRAAVDAGADILHLDIRLTADNRPVVIHDGTVDRTSNGKGTVAEISFADIRSLDAGGGEKVPALEDVCELIMEYPDIIAVVNISDNSSVTVDLALEMLSLYGILDRCIFACRNTDILKYIHRRSPLLRTLGFFSAESKAELIDKKGSIKPFAVAVSPSDLNPALTYDLEKAEILPWCYLPKDEKEIYLAGICGANLLVCEDVELAVKLLRKQNEKATD